MQGKYYQVILNAIEKYATEKYATLQYFLYQARHFCLATAHYSFDAVGYKSTNATKTFQMY